MRTVEPPARPRRRATWVVGGGLIVAGLGGLVTWAVTAPGALNYYRTPSEIVATTDAGRSFRVGGRVAPNTFERDGSRVRFSLTDGKHAVPVVYRGDVPDTLKESTDAVAEGSLRSDGTLVATRVLAKCSSKFVPEDRPQDLGKT